MPAEIGFHLPHTNNECLVFCQRQSDGRWKSQVISLLIVKFRLQPAGGKSSVSIVVIMGSQTELLQIVHATASTGCFTGSLYRWQEHRDQQRDDGDDDQQFNQREAARGLRTKRSTGLYDDFLFWNSPDIRYCGDEKENEMIRVDGKSARSGILVSQQTASRTPT